MAETGRRTVNQVDIVEVDASPTTGIAAPVGSLALRSGGAYGIWQKTGQNDTDWRAIGTQIKAGSVNANLFSGNPKKASVTFSSAFASALYSVSFSGVDSRIFTVESKTQSGFTINANANATLTGSVNWTAIFQGESA